MSPTQVIKGVIVSVSDTHIILSRPCVSQGTLIKVNDKALLCSSMVGKLTTVEMNHQGVLVTLQVHL